MSANNPHNHDTDSNIAAFPRTPEAHRKADGEDTNQQGSTTMSNSYEEKLEARRQRYLELAEAARRESDACANRSREMADVIPFGQPILVGHHSERRDRNYREKIWRKMGQSVDLSNRAKYYEQKAAAVGRAGISSDDPEAVAKLKRKLEGMESGQERMKAANKVVRKRNLSDADKVAELVAMGYKEAEAVQILKPDFCGRVGFPGYALQNNNANMRRVRERIADLERAAQREPIAEEFDGFEMREEDNRVQFIFDGKPSAEVRAVLKGHAFKWSPSRGAWVRKSSPGADHAARCVVEKLKGLEI